MHSCGIGGEGPTGPVPPEPCAEGDFAQVTAIADLDGDGIESNYWKHFSVINGELAGEPIAMFNELE